MVKSKLQGIFAPITTPFDARGTVLYDHLASNMQRYATSDLKGFLVFGSNGENKSLSQDEKLHILKIIAETKAPQQTLLVASIYESTKETLEFALLAQESGADFITLMPPSYFKSAMKDSVLFQYFSDVASELEIPCMLYKAPQFSGGLDLSLELVSKCSKHPNIIGIKDSSSGGIEKLLQVVPDDFSVLSGSANTFLPAMLNGAVGGILSIANYLPHLAVELYNYVTRNELQKAIVLNKQIITLNMAISGIHGVSGVKRAMDLLQFHGDFPRRPLLPIPPEADAKLTSVLREFQSISS
ncbi:MAG: dihydrodipicolinate synthase family protein [Sphaerochaetaceae bacterium]